MLRRCYFTATLSSEQRKMRVETKVYSPSVLQTRLPQERMLGNGVNVAVNPLNGTVNLESRRASRLPTRQWVVSVPIPLRYWMAPSRELTARVHTIIRRTLPYTYEACRARCGDVRNRQDAFIAHMVGKGKAEMMGLQPLSPEKPV
jgi:hypothetical protein